MEPGPVVIGFDGTSASERAVRAAAALLGSREALVVTVWEHGRVFDMAVSPMLAMPAATMDVRTANEIDRAAYEQARSVAQRGTALTNEVGFRASGMAVADDVTVADTLIRLADEHAAAAIVVGAHNRGAVSELLLGSTSRGVVQRATCPVVVVREPSDS